MSNDTETIVKEEHKTDGEPTLFKVSIRGWVVLMVFGTMCLRELAMITHCIFTNTYIEQVKEPMYGAVMALIGFYFGQKTTGTPATTTTTTKP